MLAKEIGHLDSIPAFNTSVNVTYCLNMRRRGFMYDCVVWMDSGYEVAEIALYWRLVCFIFKTLSGIFNLTFQGLTGPAHERKFSIYNYSLVSLTWTIT